MPFKYLDEPTTSKFRYLDEEPVEFIDSSQTFARRHPLASNPTFQQYVTRPAAQYRSAVRGAFAGKNPIEELQAGAVAEGEDLVSRAAPFNFRTPVQTFINRVMPFPKTGLDIVDQTALGTVADVGALGAETVANMATNPTEAIAGLFPFSRVGKAVGGAIAASKPGQFIQQVMTKSRRTPLQILKGHATPISSQRLMTLSETELAKLPPAERTVYFQAQANEAMLARQQTAFQLKQRSQQAIQQLQDAKVQAERQLPSVAHASIQRAETKLNQTLLDQSTEYRRLYDAAFAKSVNVPPFTPDEVLSSLYDEFIDDPIAYRRVESLLTNKPFFKDSIEKSVNLSARELATIADELSETVSRAARQKMRAYTPDEVLADKLRHSILNLLEKRGVPIRESKDFWREWVGQRDLALKLQTSSGPRTLIRITRGQDPVRAEHLQQLEALMDESVDTQTKQAFAQLDTLQRQQVLEKAKLAEKQYLLSQRTGVAKGSEIFKKLRVEQQARRNRTIRRAIYGALVTIAAQTTLGKSVLKTGRDILLPK